MTASGFLEGYATESLKIMARRRGMAEATSASKSRLIAFLEPRLFDPEANRHMVQSLPPRQKRILADLKARDNEADTVALAAAVEGESADAAADIRALVEMGLLLYPRQGGGRRYRIGECQRVWMHASASGAVETKRPSGSPPRLLAAPPPMPLPASFDLLLGDLFIFLEGAHRLRLRPPGGSGESAMGSGRGAVPQASQEQEWSRLGRSLLLPESLADGCGLEQGGRLYFLYLLLEETGLLKVRRNRLVQAEEAAVFWRLPQTEQASRLFAAWEHMAAWNEFWRITELVLRPAPGRGEEHVPPPGRLRGARRRVVTALKGFDCARWYAFSSLRREIKARHPEFLIRRHPPRGSDHLYTGFGERGRGGTSHALDLTADWDRVEGRFIARLLLEPLHWLGAIDLGFDQRPGGDLSRVDAFRITPLGAFLLGCGEAPPAPGPVSAVVQPDFDILLLATTVDTALLHDLSRFATFTGGDRVLRFTLSRPAVQRAFRDGWNRGRILACLEEASATPLPQNIGASLADWERAFQRFRIVTGVTLLEDPEGILAGMDLAASLDHRLGTAVAEGLWRPGPGELPALRSSLRRRRIDVCSFDYQRPGHGLSLGPGLAIRQHQRGRDWTTTALLRRVALPAADEGEIWRLDRALVRRAFKAGASADDLLRDLEARAHVPAPDLRLVLHAWWRKADGPALTQAAVLTCPDAALMRLLLESPTLAPFLGERLGPDAILLSGKSAAPLRRALRELGLTAASGIRLAPRQGPAAGEATTSEPPAGTVPFRWSRQAAGAPPRSRSARALRFLLTRAIARRRNVRLEYNGQDEAAPLTRDLSPLRLDEAALVAACPTTGGERVFDLSHITSVTLLPEHY